MANLTLHGHLRIWDADGNLITEGHNTVVNAGLEALVDALVAAAYINTFKYVSFGLGTGATEAADTALESEVTGGTYARLTATQAEGDNAREYRLSGTWTNNSGASRVVTEYGIHSAATDGTMLARVSTGDGGGPTSKTVAALETITVTWDLQLADA